MTTQQARRRSSQTAAAIALTMLLLQPPLAVSPRGLHPVILIPGAGGNQLEARLTAEYRPGNIICRLSALIRRRNWFRLWLDPTVLLPPLAGCFAERMKLAYLFSDDDFHNAAGVVTRVPNFGSTQSLLYLEPCLNGPDIEKKEAYNKCKEKVDLN